MTDAELVSFGEVRCQLPHGTNRRRRDIAITQPTGFLVSVTTNGNMFSNKVPVVIFDSSCTDCFLKNGSFTCSQKDNICIVNGKCFELSSKVCASKVDSESKHLWIIGAVLGGLAFICIVALLVAKLVLIPRMRTGSSYPSAADQSPSFGSSKTVYKQ
ncbi:von Willebrand factor D and EGF domain-containing protein-like [Mytilus edulis]|uniref:von Willebrand factor D and EGF domain-containing protein-like n=1 Tax=Mytilus edulis TaxID=6550 RepID=UPI0039EF1D99